MIRSQQLNVEERTFEGQSDESEDEFGYNENFNRDRIDVDVEEELRRRWIGLVGILVLAENSRNPQNNEHTNQ